MFKNSVNFACDKKPADFTCDKKLLDEKVRLKIELRKAILDYINNDAQNDEFAKIYDLYKLKNTASQGHPIFKDIVLLLLIAKDGAGWPTTAETNLEINTRWLRMMNSNTSEEYMQSLVDCMRSKSSGENCAKKNSVYNLLHKMRQLSKNASATLNSNEGYEYIDFFIFLRELMKSTQDENIRYFIMMMIQMSIKSHDIAQKFIFEDVAHKLLRTDDEAFLDTILSFG